MYIEPNTHLEFFQDLHIDPDYENTIYFPTTYAKDTYFDNLQSIKTPKCYYQRQNRGYCRVEIPVAQLLDRSYMRFKNNNFENKWFYAFVLDVEYINNITTEVHYQLDVMMTWCGGGYVLDECFVEREHTETDAIGENVVPESFDLGIMVNNTLVHSGLFDEWVFLEVFEPDSSNLTPAGNDFGFPTGLAYSFVRNLSDITSLPALLLQRLIGVYYVPTSFIPAIDESRFPESIWEEVQNNGTAPVVHSNRVFGPVAGTTTLDGYLPHNNKLYTHPYYYLNVENSEGESKDYLFELTRTNYIDFEFRGIVGELTQVDLIPKGYDTPIATDPNNNRPNYAEKMEMTNFPMCGWTVDTYRAFLAQQMVSLPANILTAGTQALMGNVMGAIGSASSTVIGAIDNSMKATVHPFEAKGKDTPQLSLAVGSEYKDFYFTKKSIRAYKAKIIDDYFTMFGYAVNEVKTPNVNARPYYTYVKTIGCHVHGSLPEADKREIESVFNKGVRFWKESHQYIGKYNGDDAPDNSPV